MVRSLLAQTTIELFGAKGFDNTTLDEVASAAGARRALFTYGTALRAAFQVLEEIDLTAEGRLEFITLQVGNGSQRAGHAEKQARWQDLFARTSSRDCPTPTSAPCRPARSRPQRSSACRQPTRNGYAGADRPTCSTSATPPYTPSEGLPGTPQSRPTTPVGAETWDRAAVDQPLSPDTPQGLPTSRAPPRATGTTTTPPTRILTDRETTASNTPTSPPPPRTQPKYGDDQPQMGPPAPTSGEDGLAHQWAVSGRGPAG
ncbi:helix-turn-helix domain-containing protein [Streptomyces griseorubiginosus]|uniref:helix-turn-helix domain-containing protein n=1 Tax=Streptomyces griseorubiginosus TaxID=67304 RepID=UPI0036C23EB2